MSISNLIWGSSQFDESVDKATSDLLPSGSEDIALNLEICDLIRSKNVSPSAAMKKLKARLNHPNPNVQLVVLSLTDTCIKNSGDPFLAEITSREFIDNLVSILKQPALNNDVKKMILYYIQNWALSLEGKSTMGYLSSKYRQLQNEGFDFPPRDVASSSAAMVETQVAPEWIDSDVCLRCRTAFSFTNRKHHCRNCGQVFDQQCSSKTRALPHFGITTEVRVCDSCFTLLSKGQLSKSLSATVHSPSSIRPRARPRSVPADYDRDLQEAIKRSLTEGRQGSSSWTSSEPPSVEHAARTRLSEEDDPDLRAAIEASLREAHKPRPSAPTFAEERPSQQFHQPYAYQPTTQGPEVPRRSHFVLPNYDLATNEADAILSFNQAVEYAESNGSFSGRQSQDVSQLFDKASRVRPKIAMSLDDTHRKHQLLMDMNHKISEVTKLYDQLLDQQISQHRWRSEAPAPSTSSPLRNETRPQAETWRQPSYTGQVHAYQQSEVQPERVLSPPHQTIPSGVTWRDSRFQPQSWEASSQPHPQYVSYNIPAVTSPVQVSSQPYASVPQLQPSSQHSLPNIPQQPVNMTKPPSAAPTVVPPPVEPPQVVPGQLMSPPAVMPAVPTVTPHAFAPQTSNSSQQTAIPLFPAVPQTEPQTFDPYNSRLNGTEPPERKEALLIDL